MQIHHDYQLRLILEEVARKGWKIVSMGALLEWYGQARISKTIWRDLLTRWNELQRVADKQGDLGIFREEIDEVLLVWMDKKDAPKDDRFFNLMSYLAEGGSANGG